MFNLKKCLKKYKHNKKKARVIQNFDLKNDLEEVLRMSSQDDLMTSSKINLRITLLWVESNLFWQADIRKS